MITHHHEDHCDPKSLAKIIEQNPDVAAIANQKSKELINEWFPQIEVQTPKVGDQLVVSPSLEITTLPSAHTEIEIIDGLSSFNGYLLKFPSTVIYHPGDTIPHPIISKELSGPIDWAFLPINERNVFRNEQGIIGNMTCREALEWCKRLKVSKMIPTHWDMFEANSTKPEELDLISANIPQVSVNWLCAWEKLTL